MARAHGGSFRGSRSAHVRRFDASPVHKHHTRGESSEPLCAPIPALQNAQDDPKIRARVVAIPFPPFPASQVLLSPMFRVSPAVGVRVASGTPRANKGPQWGQTDENVCKGKGKGEGGGGGGG